MRIRKLSGVVVACALGLTVVPVLAQTASPPASSPAVRRPPATSVPSRSVAVRPTPTLATTTAVPATTVAVPANIRWAPTRITLESGGFLRLSATGRWSAIGQQLRAASNVNTSTDANGYPNTSGQPTILSTANRGALIGRVGENGTPFLVGATYEGAVRDSGLLYLSMNDGADQFTDNSGRLAVNVNYTPPQPAPTPNPNEPPREDQPQSGAPVTTSPGTDVPTTTTTEPVTTVETTTTVDPATGQTTTSVETTTAVDPTGGDADDDVLFGLSQEELVRYGLIGAAVLGGLLLLSRLFRPRSGGNGSGDKKKQGGGDARVGTRVIDDGVSTQNLSIRT